VHVPGWLEVWWRHTPYAPLVLAVTAVAVVVLARPVGRRLRLPALGVAAWVAALGLVVALTLTPREPQRSGERVCALDSWTPLDLHNVLALDQRAANVLLLVPLALLAALPRDARTRRALLGLVVALPFVVEAVQYAVPRISRICDSNDLVDNLVGVAVGAAVGTAVRLVASLAHRRRRGGKGRPRRASQDTRRGTSRTPRGVRR